MAAAAVGPKLTYGKVYAARADPVARHGRRCCYLNFIQTNDEPLHRIVRTVRTIITADVSSVYSTNTITIIILTRCFNVDKLHPVQEVRRRRRRRLQEEWKNYFYTRVRGVIFGFDLFDFLVSPVTAIVFVLYAYTRTVVGIENVRVKNVPKETIHGR